MLLLLNIVLFGFFQEATGNAVTSIVTQEAIVRKTQFPRLVIPLAVVLTALFNLGLNLVVVFVFLLAFGVTPMWTWLLFPVLLVALFVFTVAVSMIVSSLYPRFRDVGIIWTVASTALFYATPVLYPLDAVSQTLRDVISLNPLAPIFELTHRWIDRRRRRRAGRADGRLRAAADPGRDLRRSPASSRCGCSAARRRASPKRSECSPSGSTRRCRTSSP